MDPLLEVPEVTLTLDAYETIAMLSALEAIMDMKPTDRSMSMLEKKYVAASHTAIPKLREALNLALASTEEETP